MKFISYIIKKFVKHEVKPLGRWNTDYCEKKTNHKIDLSNEDHCGPCGEYVLNQTKKEILKKEDNIIK